uniref:Uncharacterized protein n=1 Tax=Pipistrellus kuhlii TaxID=59472 RepID=A0A7J7SVQ8_PIPKU|nr:hypothetical protein mPipKuh1_009753 [Pipistrellus kuhlii]
MEIVLAFKPVPIHIGSKYLDIAKKVQFVMCFVFFLEQPTLFASWMIPLSAFELMQFSPKIRFLVYAISEQLVLFALCNKVRNQLCENTVDLSVYLYIKNVSLSFQRWKDFKIERSVFCINSCVSELHTKMWPLPSQG